MAQMPRPAYYFALGAPGQWRGHKKAQRRRADIFTFTQSEKQSARDAHA
jgi:hypothetical protein